MAGCWLHKVEDQGLISRIHIQNARLHDACKPSAEEVDTVKSLGLTGEPVQPNQ